MKTFLTFLMFLLLSHSATLAQGGRRITGKVVDEKGVVLPGVVVNGKNSQVGTVTDVDGNYAITVPDGVNILVYQYVGYERIERPIGPDSVMNVNMLIEAHTLEGAVVTANAVRREKRELGYATTQITGSELTTGGNTSPINALVGKAAGVNINSTANAPGSSSRIVLRGGSSLTGNNQALIVVDGVPINNSNFATNGNIGNLSNQVDYGNRANDINPDDIESISVLKGPAATALYGSMASNGAIMITTKKGRKRTGPSKTDIEVSSSYELSSILKYPDLQNTYGQGNIYEGIRDDRRENFSWGEKFNGQIRPWGQIINGEQQIKPYEALPNNVRDFFDVGQTWNNNVGMNGGNENAAYRLSLGSLNSKSIFPGKTYDRYNVGFNGNAELSNKVTSSINVNYVKINSDLPGFGQREASVLDNLYQTPRDIPISHLKDLSDPFNSINYTDATGVQRYGYYGAYALNPYYTLQEFKNLNDVDRIFGNFIIGYKPATWLTITNRLAADNIADRRFQLAPKFNSEPFDPLYTGAPHINNGRYSEDIYNTSNIFNDLMITYDRNVAKDLHLNVLLAQNYSQFRTSNTFASTNEEGGLITPGYYNLSNSNGTPLTANNLSLVRRVGLYSTVSAGYKNMLFLGLNMRNDWSSTIKNSYFYYGANTSFVFTELMEGDLKDKVWNYGKFRVSYGSVGNDAPPYSDQTTYTRAIANGNFGSTIFPFGGIGAFSYDNTLGLGNIQPEFSEEFEIGTEDAFWNNRITVDFSYYNKRSRNQIVPVPVATSSGFTAKFVNTGLITNSGVELAMRVTVLRAAGMKWDIYGTYTRNRNEVKEIFAGTDQIVLGGISGMSIVAAVGKPYGTFYTTGHELTADGRMIVDSATGIPKVSTTAMYYATYLPDYQASLGTSFSYKGFGVNVLFDTKQGGIIYSRTRDVLGFVGTSKETEDREEQVWANSAYLGSDGQYHNNTTPYMPYSYYTSAGLRPESENLVNASYVKLREASISYNLPAKWFTNIFIGSATVSVYGNNLFIWTPASNQYVDPEVNSSGAGNAQGFDFSAQPSLRRYGINLKFTF
ncbi:SusC/RagA family TonB-linked outer membrane protein [Nemorincola caseinilytica]|uniref:SusC/RagA family TonB-linked outer membrane protein n=1 Tax=Nemorincola caseinilytica TaxID=2054315 RepID=A0ABP8NP14_9BACT